MVTAIFDQDVPAHILLQKPGLYEHGRRDLAYKGRFWPNMIDGLWQGTLVYFLVLGVYQCVAIGRCCLEAV